MIVVRQEREKEYLETEAALREAFWDQYAPGASEHYLAHCLRTHPAFVPELALVAAEEERIIGAVMCLRTPLLCDDGAPREVLTVGPLGVIPSCQRRGVGAFWRRSRRGDSGSDFPRSFSRAIPRIMRGRASSRRSGMMCGTGRISISAVSSRASWSRERFPARRGGGSWIRSMR